MGLLDFFKNGLDQAAYNALGGPLLGDQLRDPVQTVTPQSLLAGLNAGAGTPQQQPATQAQSPQTAAPVAGAPANAAGAAWQGDDSQQQTPPLPGPQVGIPGAGPPAAAAAGANAQAATALSGPQAALPGAGAGALPQTAATGDRTQAAINAAASVMQQQQQQAPWTPTKAERGAMWRSFLGNIGGAMQAGLPIQAGVNAYRTATLDMLQQQHQARQALVTQQAMQALSAGLVAAGGDPAAQSNVVRAFLGAFPTNALAGVSDFIKATTPVINEPVGTPYPVVGPNGTQVWMQNYKMGGPQPAGFKPTEKGTFSYTPDGNIFNSAEGTSVPGPIFNAFLGKHPGDPAAAWADMKQSGVQPTEAGIAMRAAGGDKQAQGAVTIEQQLKGTASQLGDEAIDKSAQLYHDTGQLPPLPRGSMDRARILNRESEMFPGSSIAGSKADYEATQGALKDITERNARIDTNERTANQSMSAALAYSRMIDRTGAPLWNRFKQANQQEIDQDPNLKAFQNHIETFANEYAAVMNPQGGGATDSSKDHARSLLSSADSQQAFENAAANLQWEMQQRRASNSDVENSLRQRYGGVQRPVDRPAPNAPGTPAAAYAQDAKGNWLVSYDGWKTYQPATAPPNTAAAAAAQATPQSALPQAGGYFNGERVKSVKKIQ